MNKYLKLMRVKHYVKNLIILLPVVLTQQLFNRQILIQNILGIIIFSLMSSIVYIVNDIRDVEADRKHPVKCMRPLASGAVSVKMAKCLVAGLFVVVAAVWGMAEHRFNRNYMMIPAVYVAINAAYSIKLKEYPLVDVFILMLGYVLRLIYGGILGGTGVSSWMYLTITAAAFFLGFGKRRNELLMYGDESRANLKLYTLEFLNGACQMSMTSTIIFYALSCADVNTAVATAGVNLLWSVPIVYIICLRYLMILNDGKSDGDPVEVMLRDKCLLLLCVIFFALLLILLYGL